MHKYSNRTKKVQNSPTHIGPFDLCTMVLLCIGRKNGLLIKTVGSSDIISVKVQWGKQKSQHLFPHRTLNVGNVVNKCQGIAVAQRAQYVGSCHC